MDNRICPIMTSVILPIIKMYSHACFKHNVYIQYINWYADYTVKYQYKVTDLLHAVSSSVSCPPVLSIPGGSASM